MPAMSIPAAPPRLTYAHLAPLAAGIRRVVLLRTYHRVSVRGLAAPTVAAFATPLGSIALDRAALDGLADLPQVIVSLSRRMRRSIHWKCTCPFCRPYLADFSSDSACRRRCYARTSVAEVLERLWGGDETLIVISSDLSHFLSYAGKHHRVDPVLCTAMTRPPQPSGYLFYEQACGNIRSTVLMLAARQTRSSPAPAGSAQFRRYRRGSQPCGRLRARSAFTVSEPEHVDP